VSRPENARSYPSLNQPFNRNQGIINLLIYPLIHHALIPNFTIFQELKEKKTRGTKPLRHRQEQKPPHAQKETWCQHQYSSKDLQHIRLSKVNSDYAPKSKHNYA
jgi:hypothetical protein